MYVLRRTINPEADVVRGWSAWGGMYEQHPFSFAEVEIFASERGIDIPDIDDPVEAAEWCWDELGIDIRRCPATGLYGYRHHDGLSCYLLNAKKLGKALKEAAWRLDHDPSCNGLTGGVCGLRPRAYHHVRDDWYVFEIEDYDIQCDS